MPEIYQNLNTSAIFETKGKVEQQHEQQQQRRARFKKIKECLTIISNNSSSYA